MQLQGGSEAEPTQSLPTCLLPPSSVPRGMAQTRGASFHLTTHSCIQSIFPESLQMPGTVLDREGTVGDRVLSDEGRQQRSRPRNAEDDSGC